MRHPMRPVLFLALLTLTACGGGDDRQPPATPEEAMAMAAESMQQGGGTEPVDPERLSDLLPDNVAGLPRSDLERQRSGAMGMVVSNAVARYQDGSRTVSIAISDIGGLGGYATMGAAAWAMTEFDRTTSSGYERTTRFEGYRAMESESRQAGRTTAELNVLVADRYILQLKGQEMDVAQLKDVARSVGLRRLAGLR